MAKAKKPTLKEMVVAPKEKKPSKAVKKSKCPTCGKC